jgi:enoyl-CoA hydratase
MPAGSPFHRIVSNRMSAPIDSEKVGTVTVLRMAHGKANAIDLELLAALSNHLHRLREAPAVVLTGTGTIFSAGVDLFRVVDGGRAYLDRFLPVLRKTFNELMAFPRPLVAAVNGHAIAGGCILVETADHRVMTSGTGRIGMTELLVGVPFPVDAIEIVRLATGGRSLSRLVNLAETVPGAEALDRGLVDELAEPEQVVARAVEVATSLAAIPPRSFELVKRELRAPFWDALESRSGHFDGEVDAAWKSDAALHSIAAYVESLRARR